MFTADDVDILDLGSYQLAHLERNAEYASMWRVLPPIYKAAHHSIELDGKVFALAPALVDLDQKTGYFCKECQQEKCSKNHTKFLDYDYGVSYDQNVLFQASLEAPIRNKKLTEFNSMALARSIQYIVHVKLSLNGEIGSRKVLSLDMCEPYMSHRSFCGFCVSLSHRSLCPHSKSRFPGKIPLVLRPPHRRQCIIY